MPGSFRTVLGDTMGIQSGFRDAQGGLSGVQGVSGSFRGVPWSFKEFPEIPGNLKCILSVFGHVPEVFREVPEELEAQGGLSCLQRVRERS